jgi:GNAT superfamily N-acetyltransferase
MNTPSPELTIRVAQVEDAECLARLGAVTFEQAFTRYNTPEDMAAYLASTYTASALALELQDPRALFLIASMRDEAVGYAKLYPSDAPERVVGPEPMEVVRFYVQEAWHGRGISHTLMREVLARAVAAGYATVWLGVWEHNARAIAFYLKWGFEAVGRKTFLLGSDLQTDIVMQRPLIRTDAGG